MEYLLISLLVGYMGASFASFCALVTDTSRPKNRRSVCKSCSKTLTWYELIPLFSYLLQKGKCRNCKKHIPAHLLKTEIAGAVLYLSLFWYFLYLQPNMGLFELIAHYAFFSIFFLLSVADSKYQEFDTSQTIVLAIVAAILRFSTSQPSISWGIDPLLASLFIGFVYLIQKGKLGEGDIVIGIIIALAFGFIPFLQTLFIASLLGIITILYQSGTNWKEHRIGLLPFLLVGTLMSLWIPVSNITPALFSL